MEFVFDIKKAIAAAGFVCQLNGGRYDMLRLIKVLYLAERAALLEWQRPITGDDFYSLENGPIVSRIYDLIRNKPSNSDLAAWTQVFKAREGDTFHLKLNQIPSHFPAGKRLSWNRLSPLSKN